MNTLMQHSQNHQQLNHLTSLRFFAAMAVLFSHLVFLKEENPLQFIANTFFYEGYAGVSFFFILSGFILSHTYQNKFSNKSISNKKYLLLRIARIYPLHFLTALPFVALAIYKNEPSSISIIFANLTLMQSWIPNAEYYFSLNGVSWSLSNEIFFYVCFAYLTKLKTKTLNIIFISVTFLIFTGILLALLSGNSNNWGADGKPQLTEYFFYVNPTTRLIDFIAGILLYRALITQKPRATSSHKHETSSVLLVFGAMLLFSYFKLPEILRNQMLYLPLMVYVIWSFSSGNGIISKFISKPIFVLLGEASFALYMIHQPIIRYGYEAYEKMGLSFSPLIPAFFLTMLSIVCSIFVYTQMERPLHNFLRLQINRMH